MGLKQRLARLAAGAPVAVFAVAGVGGRERVRRLATERRVELVDSPRHAAVLLVAGTLPRALYGAALAVHDELPPSRHTVVWDDRDSPVFTGAPRVGATDVLATLLAVRAAPPEPPLLLDVDPTPWRGIGPYGHGGKGMTAGTPHGRPLPGRAADRDGLQLDQLAVRVGPFFPAFGPGLVLDIKLQGDVVQEATVADNPFTPWRDDDPVPRPLAPFEAALHRTVPIAELEMARARHHLHWVADALRVQGLPALGMRAARLAYGLGPGTAGQHALRRLIRRVEASQVLRWSLPSVDVDPIVTATDALGPVARAAGHREDARLLDPAYARLGFEPVTHARGDVAARWRQRLAEAEQALALVAAAGPATTTVTGTVESPRGPLTAGGGTPSAHLLRLLPGLLAGLEWGDAVATVVSMDVDVEEAARVTDADRPLVER